MTAPDRVWAWFTSRSGDLRQGQWQNAPVVPPVSSVDEYLRRDGETVRALVEALRLAEHDQIDIVGQCKILRDQATGSDQVSLWNMRNLRLKACEERLALTRAALAKLEGRT